MIKLAHYFLLSLLFLPSAANAAPLDFYADALLRYEDDYRLLNSSRRERIRFTGHAGVQGQIGNQWHWNLRASTGLKDRQNVPAVTLKQFTDQSYPDRNVFIDRAYVVHERNKLKIWVGKTSWLVPSATAVFWDSDLAVYGASARYAHSDQWAIFAAALKPLDGQTRTTGTLNYAGVSNQIGFGAYQVTMTPWFVDFHRDTGTEYTNRDVEFDHRSIRLSTIIKKDRWRYAVDLGRALNSFNVTDEFSDQKDMIVGQVSYGDLKRRGHWQAMARYLYIERFGVVKEFAQNSTSRFETSNYQGLELRFRRQMGENWWLGTRFADTRTIAGEKERGRRFRIEAKVSFD